MKLPEPFVYFVDRSLGGSIVVQAMRDAGETAHAHDDYFDQATPDAEWLAEVGKRGWVVLTKDKEIRRNQLESVALVESGVACFMLGRGSLKASRMGDIFVAALPRMRRVLRRYDVALAASISAGGAMRVLLAGGEWLDPARDVK